MNKLNLLKISPTMIQSICLATSVYTTDSNTVTNINPTLPQIYQQNKINHYCRELEAASLSSCRIHGTPPPAHLMNGGSINGINGVGGGSSPPLCPAPGPLEETLCRSLHAWYHCPEVHKAIDGVNFIADHTKREEDSTRVSIITK